MLCSNCRREIKPVVAVDIDGVLGNYHGHFLDFARAYLGLNPLVSNHAYDGAEGFKEWFLTWYDCDETTWQQIKLAYRQGGMKRSMPVYPGAIGMAHAIRESGAELWLTTTRPYLRLDNIDPDTRFWLERHSITPYDGLLYDELKYKRLWEIVDPTRVVAVVDDLPEMLEAAGELFGQDVPIMRRTIYNYGGINPALSAYDTLGPITDLVVQRINTWKDENNAGT
jgi:hypothetical protein